MTSPHHFIGLSRTVISRIARDPSEPQERRAAARRYLTSDSKATTAEARAAFERATARFEQLAARHSPAQESGVEDVALEPHPPVANKTATLPPKEPVPFVAPSASAIKSIKFVDLADEYLTSWKNAKLEPGRISSIDAVRARLLASASRYKALEAATGVPWFFTGTVHALEASFDFSSHLHNGDPLTDRTRRIPRGRPAHGTPPFTWNESAEDALRGHDLHKITNWSLARILYELERYNGFGYRYRRTHSPYLWSGSSRYVSGKYVRDGIYDANAVSKQIGAAVILKRMVEVGDMADPLPTS